ncbi:MAG TPA: nucleotide sugar dehydrogenase [Solirubrobacteraceae bacterium]|nr:nucleotide sugar dehydrogenase [Solirubrobacteraceae bacterium]
MSDDRQPIGVIGTGYVGLVSAAGFAHLGSEVYCIDIDADKIARLEAGEIPIYEPGLAEMVAANRDRLHFSTDIADALERARLLFIAVGTPPTYSGDADLSAVHAVVAAIPASERHALVMKSTVPAGTGASIKRVLAENGKPGLSYVSCPEFLKEGSAVKDFLDPDRVVVGDDGDWAGDAVVELYAPLDAALVRTDIASAEMVKLASNAFLATKISFINEIANVCEETGADVVEVARGMGLDDRIGHKFLQAGIGFGGSCLTGDESVLVRLRGRTTLMTFERLWERLESDGHEVVDGVLEPYELDVLSWIPGGAEPQFMPVMCVTRRDYEGDIVEVRTKMGRRIRCTPDHPWIVHDAVDGGEPELVPAALLGTDDWVPLAQGRNAPVESAALAPMFGAVEAAQLHPSRIIVRLGAERAAALAARPMAERREIFAGNVAARSGEVRRTGTVRLDEAGRAGLDVRDTLLGTASNGMHAPSEIALDTAFWRVAGLYLAEGCTVFDERNSARITWSFHREKEQHLVDEVVAFWMRHGVAARARRSATAHVVTVQSRLLGAWWTRVLGMGRNSYEQRLPDLVWDRPTEDKWAILSGLWEGDGSWSLVNGGPSVILEMGTVSRELSDGVQRLLGELGIVVSQRIGRVSKSTKDTYWLRISGADQVEHALALVPERDRAGAIASIDLQTKRTAPMGYRWLDDDGPAWLRVVSTERTRFSGDVYSMEVPGVHTFVTTGGITVSNCFPKDVNALKQLAGNSGYHFQLLNAVIEVNELQKRRVISKLQKHLGSLVGHTICLLGLAFKPNTDDMREASSLVLSARLQADGAKVRVFDPVAEEEARHLIQGVYFASDALDAVDGADAVVLVTEWDEFVALDWDVVAARMSGTLVLDGRNALDREAVAAAGLTYEGIGRGTLTSLI